jgi:hypothetical protein
MLRKKGKPSIEAGITTPSSVEELVPRLNESHQMTLNQPFGVKEAAESLSTSIEYHLTIQITNSSLSRRELSLLLDVLNFQAVYFGANLNMVLAMYELYFKILGNKRNAAEIYESKIRLTLTVSEILLKIFGKDPISLSSEEGFKLTSHPFQKLLKVHGLMSKRTYGSRYRTWRPEKYLKVRIVPVDIQFLKRRDNSVRYSSYTKGYGESHPSAHRQRTKPSAELDGTGESPVSVEERKLFTRCTEPTHVLCEFLLIRYNNFELEEESV